MAKAPRQVRKAPATPKPAAAAASTPADAIAVAPAAPPAPTPAEQEPAAPPAPPAEAAPPAEPAPLAAPAGVATARSEMVWMKMTTGLSGPDISLSPGQHHRFDVDEAERLEQAGFAELSDGPEA